MESIEHSAKDPREEICRSLGIAGIAEAHQLILSGVKNGPEWLIRKNLDARALQRLGYSAEGMRRMGYPTHALQVLGYSAGPAPQPVHQKEAGATHLPAHEQEEVNADGKKGDFHHEPNLERMIKSGFRATDLRKLGYSIHHCKHAGYTAMEMEQLGFQLHELVQVYHVSELRRADFSARELKTYFNGHELKTAGFSAGDMHQAGYSVRELLNLGYNENHIKTAGFSMAELAHEGLGRQTKIEGKKR